MLADDARLQIMLEELQQENENLSIQCNQLKATNAGLVADAARMLEGLQQENQNLLVQCGELTANAETSRKEFEECRTTIDAKQMHIEHLEIQLEDLQKQLREERKYLSSDCSCLGQSFPCSPTNLQFLEYKKMALQ